jgi:hypothetical protein
MGMNSPAQIAGFARDGSVYGYCHYGGGIESTRCEFVDRDGNVTEMFSQEGRESPAELAKRAAITRYVDEKGIPTIDVEPRAPSEDPSKVKGPPLFGSWTFTDITIDVARVTPPPAKDSSEVSAVLKIGGTVSGEPAPVHPITLRSPTATTTPAHFVAINAISISPDKREIGMLGTFFGGEYADTFAMKRLSLGAFAGLVYNDTGMRHHAKGDYPRSAQLFAKAVAADPDARLAPYNLACAWARTTDPRAKDALAYAITKDPTAKARARTDKDFADVKAEAWFSSATK